MYDTGSWRWGTGTAGGGLHGVVGWGFRGVGGVCIVLYLCIYLSSYKSNKYMIGS